MPRLGVPFAWLSSSDWILADHWNADNGKCLKSSLPDLRSPASWLALQGHPNLGNLAPSVWQWNVFTTSVDRLEMEALVNRSFAGSTAASRAQSRMLLRYHVAAERRGVQLNRVFAFLAAAVGWAFALALAIATGAGSECLPWRGAAQSWGSWRAVHVDRGNSVESVV